jgi:outer membrane protein OmpU
MKKLLIATTALVATAGMASADITITGKANAGYYSGLHNKDAVAAYTGKLFTAATKTASSTAALTSVTTKGTITAAKALTTGNAVSDEKAARAALFTAQENLAARSGSTAAELADLENEVVMKTQELAIAETVAKSVGTYTESGVYSNAGVVITMSGATDGGITFSTSVDAEAGTEIDAGDFEYDGAASGTFALGAVTVSGAFGTLTFDDAGIDNLYDDDLTAADVKYSTTIGGVSLTAAMNAQSAAANDNTSLSASYTSGAMTFSGATSDSTAGTSASLAVSYVVSDSLTVRADNDQAAGAEAVQSIGVTTSLNGVSIVADTANDSTWDVSLGYTVNGVALTYASDESSSWSATASYALGGGATATAGINEETSMYAGVSFAF